MTSVSSLLSFPLYLPSFCSHIPPTLVSPPLSLHPTNPNSPLPSFPSPQPLPNTHTPPPIFCPSVSHLSLRSSILCPAKGRKFPEEPWQCGLLGEAGAEVLHLSFWRECLLLRLLSRPRLSLLLPPRLARRRSLHPAGGWLSSSPSSCLSVA